MLKRFSQFFACLLLVLIPLQSVAAANMSICNSLMQSNEQQAMQNMSCHDDMNSNTQHKEKHGEKNICKSSCARLCASLGTMTALPSDVPAAGFLASITLGHLPQQTYVSVIPPNLQRPPISFI